MSIETIRFSPEIEVEYPDDVDTNLILDGPENDCSDCDSEENGYDCGDCDGNCEVEDISNFVIKGWDITGDCSLENGFEFKPMRDNKLYYNKESLASISKLLKKIKSRGGYAEENCGLHIHVDVEKFTDKQITNIIKTFVENQSRIISKFRVYQDRLDEYCHPLPEQLKDITPTQIREFRNNYRDDFWKVDKKFYALNIGCIPKNNYKTLEFRLFNGTISYRTIKSYILWVLNFVDTAKDGKYV